MTASTDAVYLTRPDVLLRLEGLVALAIECFAYQHFYPGRWGIFALLFLAPDVSLLGYLRSAGKSSAAFYNVVHSDVLPLAMGLIAWTRGPSLAGQLALIWLSHISFDRCLGFGLKFTGDFRSTHIQSAAASRPPCVQQ